MSCENKTGNGNLSADKFYTETRKMIRKHNARRKKEESRIDIIGRNGNDGEHYGEVYGGDQPVERGAADGDE